MKPADAHDSGSAQPYRISISAAVLQLFTDTLTQVGVAYGPCDEQIIAEDTLNGHRLQVSLRQDGGDWILTVRGHPPLDAVVTLHAEQHRQEQAFSAAGEVHFLGVPEAFLRTGFDLVIKLVPSSST